MNEHSENHLLIKQIDKWSGWLTALVVIIPFIVSYGALKDLAAANGVNYPFMYPLMIDLSLIIFNLIALRSSLHGERNLYAWTLVVIATFISVVLNIVHAQYGILPMFMAALPPLFILAAFHLVVLRIEHTAKRHQVVNTLSHMVKRIKEVRAEHEQLNRQNETLRQEAKTHHEQLAALREQLVQSNDELSRLQNEQLTAVHEQVAQAQNELSRLHREQSALKQQIALMKRVEQTRTEDEQSEIDGMNSRRERLLALLKDPASKMTQTEMAELLGVSLSTIRRDLQMLNGQVTG
jgi:cell division protein FtsB